MDEPSNFELIRDTLLRMDPETRAETIEAMKVFQTVPRPVGVSVLAHAAMRANLYAPRVLVVTAC